MPNLQIDAPLNGQAQLVEDPTGTASMLAVSTTAVGIGTTAPAQTLDVAGGLKVSRHGDGAILLELSSERSWAFRQRGTDAGTALELASIGGGGNKNFLIATDGMVGIGTTAPSHKLHVEGSIRVTEDVILDGADCAEEFDIDPSSHLEPGTVMVIGPERRLQHCVREYDTRVAGIVSGAGDRRPGIVLGRRQGLAGRGRLPVALTGTAQCHVDASVSPIEVGDLLTTSAHPGRAMRATDRHAPSAPFSARRSKAFTLASA